MRIVHALGDFNDVGGIQTYVRELAAAQRALGHEVRVVAGAGPADLHASDVAAFHPDIVHAHDAWFEGRVGGARHVRSFHNFDFGCSSRVRYLGEGEPCTRGHGPGCVLQWPRCAHTLRIDHLARHYQEASRETSAMSEHDAVVVYSRYVADLALAVGVDEARLQTVPCPAPRVEIDPGFETAEPGMVTFIGRLAPSKGADVLIRAVAEVGEARLRIVGAGFDEQRVRELAEKVAPGRVEFLGWRAGDALWAEYARATVVVMPNRWPEPFGLVGVEAGWAGRPVIASHTGGVKDWLKDGETGIGVKAGSVESLAAAVDALVSDPGTARVMGAAGRAHIEAWPDAQDHARALLASYEVPAGS
ncbi:glycosyltransferase family 4 protein [Demequina subtropica]|uniref:glycosyltransferase family 4 protein n=1 Tax=Demequina subtropica TaxID=1638989 RepID=UPI00078110C1|nr:glycosyltransferase family 4 protein [Demequina subtropica]